MQQPTQKRRRGNRAGSNKRRDSNDAIRLHDIHSRIGGLPNGHTAALAHNVDHRTTATAVIAHKAPLYEISECEETVETHGPILRKSATFQNLLKFSPPEMEFEPIKGRQLDKQTGVMVEVNEQRLVWKGDKTLLRRGNPFADPEAVTGRAYVKEASVSVGTNTRKFRKGIDNAEPLEQVKGTYAEGVDPDAFYPEKIAAAQAASLAAFFPEPDKPKE
jgi:hypothetical protein